MHKLVGVLFFVVFFFFVPVQSYRSLPGNWTLTWYDEFDGPDGSKPSEDKWTVADQFYHFGNDELQLYTKDNVYIQDGKLVLRSIESPTYMGYNYTSGWLSSLGKAHFRYGRFDIRAKLPRGQGMWPAHWMLPADKSCWPVEGEIDIMEYIGVDPGNPLGPIHGTLHWAKNNQCGQDASLSLQYGPYGVDYTADFHTFSVIWDPSYMLFYVDSVFYSIVPKWVFTPSVDFYFIINTAVGGNWPGPPSNQTQFPQYHLVDYVRYYKGSADSADVLNAIKSEL